MAFFVFCLVVCWLVVGGLLMVDGLGGGGSKLNAGCL